MGNKAKTVKKVTTSEVKRVTTSASDERKQTEKKPSKEKVQSPVDDKVTLIALQNTTLPDNTFVAEGDKVVVNQEYAQAVLAEVRPHFAPAS